MLRHPNILDIFDAGIDGGLCYIVMEVVADGGTLRPYCRSDNMLPMNQAAEIISKCEKALDYAHRQGVIHRDMKASNILFIEEMDVKIAGFSIAHAAHADMSDTTPMGFVGSPRYMSPEQVREDVIATQTDIFSMGIIAYELFASHHPFGGESFSTLAHQIVNEDPTPLRNYRSDVLEILEHIISRALEKATARRYSIGFDLASDLSMAFINLERPQEDVSIKDKFDHVKRLEFFRGFPDSDIWEIIRTSVWQEVGVDEAIIHEGDIEDSFFIIIGGRVNVSKQGQFIGQLDQGDCFGEMGYLSRIQA